jgi:Tat protein translocase TatC
MNRIWWWLIDRLSRSLEPNERDIVLGDFTESGDPAGRALLDLLGLVVRRQTALWGGCLLRTLAGVIIGGGLSFLFRDAIYAYLASPLVRTLRTFGLRPHWIYRDPLDPFFLYLKLSIMTGVFLTSPYVSWQFWTLASPRRYRHDKHHVGFFVSLTSTLFVMGGLFAYKVALPAATRFLVSYYGSHVWPMLTMNEYWDTAIFIMVGVSLLFELPSLCWLVYLRRAEKARRTIQP